jgi:hypothetical protein
MRSANEIAGLVLKAARGAGMALGCAEELARAAPYLASKGALDLVPNLLEMPFESPALENSVVSGGHPVQAMTAWLDLCAAGLDVQLKTDVGSALQDAMQSAQSPVGPFEVKDAVWSVLVTYAERTFVPESAESRLAGAGAGLTDND